MAVVICGTGLKQPSLADLETRYVSGYGDLCLNRVFRLKNVERHRSSELKASDKEDALFLHVESQRNGQFQFFKLPLELRHKVYRYLLLPYFTIDQGLNADYVRIGELEKFEVFCNTKANDRYWKGTFEDFVQIKAAQIEEREKDHAELREEFRRNWEASKVADTSGSEVDIMEIEGSLEKSTHEDSEYRRMEDEYINFHCTYWVLYDGYSEDQAVWTLDLEPEEFAKQKAVFLKNKWRHFQAQKPHPHRSIPYIMVFHPRLETKASYGWANEVTLVQFIQNLSYVSRQFREELSSIFWNRLAISSDEYKMDSLLPFLEDRPLVQPKLKSLSLYLNFSEDFESQYKSLRSIANMVHLDQLKISAGILKKHIGKIIGGEGKLASTTIIRAIKVAKSFSFRFHIIDDRGFHVDFEEEDKKEFKSRCLYELQIAKFIVPTTLRDGQWTTKHHANFRLDKGVSCTMP